MFFILLDDIEISRHKNADGAAYMLAKLHDTLNSGGYTGDITVENVAGDAVTFSAAYNLPDDFVEQVEGIE